MVVNGLHVTAEPAKWRQNAQDGAIGNLRGRPQAEVLCVFEHANGLGKSQNETLMFCANLIPKHAIFKTFWKALNSLIWAIEASLPFNT